MFFMHRYIPGERAQYIQSGWALRALIVGVVQATIVIAILLAVLPEPKPERKPDPVTRPSITQSYSLGVDARELETTIKAAHAAFNVYLKRDRAGRHIDGIANEFARVNSEADLLQVFKLLATTSGDDYIGIFTAEQYRDRMARLSGATVGVDATVTWDFRTSKYTLSRVGPSAEKQGLRQGDEIVEIMGLKIPKENPYQIAQAVEQMMANGLLDSDFEVVVIRDGKEIRIPLKRTVTSRAVAFEIGECQHPLSGKPMPNARSLTFHHLRSDTLANDLYQQLKTMQDKGVEGLVVDLREIGDATGNEVPMRIAAMFLQSGQLGCFITVTPEGTLEMKSYYIEAGKVHVKTQGPFAVDADGKLADKPSKPDVVEIKNWPCDVFRGQVTAIAGRQTHGGGEAIAAAFTQSWTRDKSRTQTVAKFYSNGKGTGQTYFPIGQNYWMRLSTSFSLQPDGSAIEGQVGPGPNVACPQNEDEHWFARHTLFVRMSTLVPPEFPANRR